AITETPRSSRKRLATCRALGRYIDGSRVDHRAPNLIDATRGRRWTHTTARRGRAVEVSRTSELRGLSGLARLVDAEPCERRGDALSARTTKPAPKRSDFHDIQQNRDSRCRRRKSVRPPGNGVLSRRGQLGEMLWGCQSRQERLRQLGARVRGAEY